MYKVAGRACMALEQVADSQQAGQRHGEAGLALEGSGVGMHLRHWQEY